MNYDLLNARVARDKLLGGTIMELCVLIVRYVRRSGHTVGRQRAV